MWDSHVAWTLLREGNCKDLSLFPSGLEQKPAWLGGDSSMTGGLPPQCPLKTCKQETTLPPGCLSASWVPCNYWCSFSKDTCFKGWWCRWGVEWSITGYCQSKQIVVSLNRFWCFLKDVSVCLQRASEYIREESWHEKHCCLSEYNHTPISHVVKQWTLRNFMEAELVKSHPSDWRSVGTGRTHFHVCCLCLPKYFLLPMGKSQVSLWDKQPVSVMTSGPEIVLMVFLCGIHHF